MRLGLLACGLMIAATAALAGEPPAPSPADIGRSDITQAEINLVWAYPDSSNAARLAIEDIEKEVPSAARDDKLKAAWAAVGDVDKAVAPIARRLVADGYWLTTGPRPGGFDDDVWLIIQHMPDHDLQATTVSQLEPLVEKGLFNGREYALMYDRLALSEGRPQSYGSQMRCVDGRYDVADLEDPDHVEERRKAMGFTETLDEYRANFKDLKCAVKPS